ncbi:C-C motif chemokine 27b [Pseudorasbora parva]|uniref:C-C motif chemokine 27b n=1 Tax=Pseudorasbora parva TaxID=51549 RepID=UPI00351E5914
MDVSYTTGLSVFERLKENLLRVNEDESFTLKSSVFIVTRASSHALIGGALTALIRAIRVSDLAGFWGNLTDLQMDLRVLAILLSITFSAAQGATPKCCVETTKKFPLEILLKVTKYDVQTSHGVCAIDALVLHANDKRYCATPKLERFLQIIQKQKMRNTLKNGSAV